MTMGNGGKDKSKGKRPFLASNTVAREEHEIRRRLDSQSNPQSFSEPSEPTKSASVVLSSAMGVFVQETVSILPDCWITVDLETKEVLWTAVKQKFIIDDHQKENILARMRKLWTDYKSRLSISIREAFQMPDATRKLKLLKPEDIKNDPSSGTRVNVWLKSRTRKNGQPINAAVAESMKKLEEISAMSIEEDQTSLKNDGIAKLKGDERPGCVKGMGFGVTPSKDHVNIDDNLDNNLAPTPQVLLSFEDSTAIPNTPTNGDTCKLLNWLGTGEVVAKRMIAVTNPEALVHHVQLGPDYYKVWVDEVNKPSLSLV
ncbi:hypothetical protein WN943_018911 [Citrus x changshan-huyou]